MAASRVRCLEIVQPLNVSVRMYIVVLCGIRRGGLLLPGIRIETIQVHGVAHGLNPRGPFLRGYGLAPGFRGILRVFPVRERADFPTSGIGKRVARRLSDNVEFHGDRRRIERGGLVDKNVRPGSIRELAGNEWFVPIEPIGTFNA